MYILGEEEFPLFGLMLDSGSRYIASKECTGFCIKYVVSETGEVAERVIGFPFTPQHAGEHLQVVLVDVMSAFNKRTVEIQRILQPGTVPDVKLVLRNLTNFGGDGANVTKFIGMNQRVLKFNARAISHWCAPHRVNCSIGHTTTGITLGTRINADVQQAKHQASITNFIKLVKSSPKQRGRQMEFQKKIKEYIFFGRKQPLQIPKCPMYRWESEFVGMLVLSTMSEANKAYLEEAVKTPLSDQGEHLKKADGLLATMCTAEFLLYMGTRLDVLSPLVFFLKELQDGNLDIDEYLEGIHKVRAELKRLISDGPGKRGPGKFYRETKKAILSRDGRFNGWDGVESFRQNKPEQIEADKRFQAAAVKQLDTFNRLFDEEREEQLEVYKIISMKR